MGESFNSWANWALWDSSTEPASFPCFGIVYHGERQKIKGQDGMQKYVVWEKR